MPVTGPVIPRHYGSTGNSPTPSIGAPAPSGVSSFSGGGELITCTKTGRMWMHRMAAAGPGGHTEAWVPVTLQFAESGLITGDTVAGVREWVTGFAPTTNSTGLELYGPTIKMQANGGLGTSVDIVGSLNTDDLGVDSTNQIQLNSSNVSPNSIHLRSPDVSCSNSGHATGANFNWFTVRASVGCEFGDQGGVGDAYRVNARINGTKAQFERMIEANDGVRVTDLPSKYLLGTDADGDLETRGLTSGTVYLTTSQTLTANTDTSLSTNGLGVTIADAGTYLFTVRVAMEHSGNYNWSMWVRHHDIGAYVLTSRTDGSGWSMQEATGIYTTVSAGQTFRVLVRSTHAPTTKTTTADGGAAAAEVKLSSLSWVRIA